MALHDRIATDPQVMFGKPVIRGTRITVEQILRKLAASMTPEQIIEEHPHLTAADIRAAEAFAADYMANGEVVEKVRFRPIVIPLETDDGRIGSSAARH